MNKEEAFDSEFEFEDSENYRGGNDTFTFWHIVLKHLKVCIEEGSKEMDKGGLKKRVIDGKVFEVVVPNQREIFINSVEMLQTLLLPEMQHKKRKKFAEKISATEKDFKKLQELLYKEKSIKEENVKKKAKDKKAELDLDRSLNSINQDFYDTLETYNVILAREKLNILSELMKELNYGQEGSISSGSVDYDEE